MNNYNDGVGAEDSMRNEFYETLEDREVKLEKKIEDLEKEINIHKAQIRKLFNITTKLGEKVYGVLD